jgi:hypothetical protein
MNLVLVSSAICDTMAIVMHLSCIGYLRLGQNGGNSSG